MTNLELDGIESILTITSQVISKQMNTTPQQLGEDQITLMTMRNIKAVCFLLNVCVCVFLSSGYGWGTL